MSIKHYNDILTRTCEDTGLDRDVVDIICKCFLYEVAEELVQRTIELPYIGDLSLKNKKLDPNKFLKDLKNQKGSYAIKFKTRHATLTKRSNKKRTGSVDSSAGSGANS
jgi:hypothetical protein